jgi:hypothetical protein
VLPACSSCCVARPAARPACTGVAIASVCMLETRHDVRSDVGWQQTVPADHGDFHVAGMLLQHLQHDSCSYASVMMACYMHVAPCSRDACTLTTEASFVPLLSRLPASTGTPSLNSSLFKTWRIRSGTRVYSACATESCSTRCCHLHQQQRRPPIVPALTQLAHSCHTAAQGLSCSLCPCHVLLAACTPGAHQTTTAQEPLVEPPDGRSSSSSSWHAAACMGSASHATGGV